MTRFRLAPVLLATALLFPAVAAAKGPSQASVSGPGLGKTVRLSGGGEQMGTPLGDLTMEAGLFPAAFGQIPDPMLKGRPSGELGPSTRSTTSFPARTGRPTASTRTSTRTRTAARSRTPSPASRSSTARLEEAGTSAVSR